MQAYRVTKKSEGHKMGIHEIHGSYEFSDVP